MINDYDWFDNRWHSMSVPDMSDSLAFYSSLLQDRFDLYVPELDVINSAWVKKTYMHPPRKGLML